MFGFLFPGTMIFHYDEPFHLDEAFLFLFLSYTKTKTNKIVKKKKKHTLKKGLKTRSQRGKCSFSFFTITVLSSFVFTFVVCSHDLRQPHNYT